MYIIHFRSTLIIHKKYPVICQQEHHHDLYHPQETYEAYKQGISVHKISFPHYILINQLLGPTDPTHDTAVNPSYIAYKDHVTAVSKQLRDDGK